ncbi:TetR/AcrR family transcriptional regulator [Dactylosporangium sp. NPDC051484]|uniref:TetR/AcrR family transcriptional regulator n=1 Tax=Dactylosporangium sp. NPDC051484 TaxID=3154942 RepID=UPI00344CBCC0
MAKESLSPLPGAREGRDPSRAIKRGPSRVPPEVVAANQRERLYDALVHTVAEKGYANATVSDICRAAGVTRPAFYALELSTPPKGPASGKPAQCRITP